MTHAECTISLLPREVRLSRKGIVDPTRRARFHHLKELGDGGTRRDVAEQMNVILHAACSGEDTAFVAIYPADVVVEPLSNISRDLRQSMLRAEDEMIMETRKCLRHMMTPGLLSPPPGASTLRRPKTRGLRPWLPTAVPFGDSPPTLVERFP